MSTFSLRRFANQEILKSIREDRLISLFDHYRKYFGDRGVNLKHEAAEEFDYHGVARVLMTGDNLREVRVSDLIERGDISVKKPDLVRFEHASRSRSARSDNRTSD